MSTPLFGFFLCPHFEDVILPRIRVFQFVVVAVVAVGVVDGGCLSNAQLECVVKALYFTRSKATEAT